jgi:hypothetical protein
VGTRRVFRSCGAKALTSRPSRPNSSAPRCAESNRRELTAPEVLCRGADSDTPIVPFLPHAGMNARGRSLDGARRTGLRRWKEAVRPDR